MTSVDKEKSKCDKNKTKQNPESTQPLVLKFIISEIKCHWLRIIWLGFWRRKKEQWKKAQDTLIGTNLMKCRDILSMNYD